MGSRLMYLPVRRRSDKLLRRGGLSLKEYLCDESAPSGCNEPIKLICKLLKLGALSEDFSLITHVRHK